VLLGGLRPTATDVHASRRLLLDKPRWHKQSERAWAKQSTLALILRHGAPSAFARETGVRPGAGQKEFLSNNKGALPRVLRFWSCRRRWPQSRAMWRQSWGVAGPFALTPVASAAERQATRRDRAGGWPARGNGSSGTAAAAMHDPRLIGRHHQKLGDGAARFRAARLRAAPPDCCCRALTNWGWRRPRRPRHRSATVKRVMEKRRSPSAVPWWVDTGWGAELDGDTSVTLVNLLHRLAQ